MSGLGDSHPRAGSLVPSAVSLRGIPLDCCVFGPAGRNARSQHIEIVGK
jgi:hypothetical protein